MQVGTDALNTVRRDLWQQLRRLLDLDFAKEFKGVRWALLTGRRRRWPAMPRNGGALWRADQRKEELLAIFAADDLTDNESRRHSRSLVRHVQRSRLDPFVRPAALAANTATGSSPRSGSHSPSAGDLPPNRLRLLDQVSVVCWCRHLSHNKEPSVSVLRPSSSKEANFPEDYARLPTLTVLNKLDHSAHCETLM